MSRPARTTPADADRLRLMRTYRALATPYYQARAAAHPEQSDPDVLRRQDLEALCDKSSSADCTPAELELLIRHLRRRGAGDGRARGGLGDGTDRPTDAQWARIAVLCRARGWDDGLTDGRLLAFVVRTCRVAAVRFLTRKMASDVILGLERWAAQASAREEAADVGA